MLQPLPETPLCSAVDNLRGTVDGMLSALSPQQTAPPAPHRGGQATSPTSPVLGGASAGVSGGASGGALGASGASGGASSGGVSGSSSARGAPVAQRVAHWQAFVRTSQARPSKCLLYSPPHLLACLLKILTNSLGEAASCSVYTQ